MNSKKELSKLISEDFIDKALEKIKEKERKRFSLPKPELTCIEFEILKGIAEGRNFDELDNAIKFYAKNDSYHSLVKRLLRKFEAFTLAHVVCKAILSGILNVSERYADK